MQYITFILGIISVLLIAIFLKKKIKANNNRYILILFSSVIIALVLEIFTFNYNSFEILGEKCEKIAYMQEIYQSEDTSSGENIAITKEKQNDGTTLYVVDITNINTVVKNVDIAFVGDAQTVECTFLYTDEAISELRQVDNGAFTIVKNIASTGHIKPDLAGKAGNFQFRLTTKEGESLSFVSVSLNQCKKFEFNGIRFIAVFLIAVLGFMIYGNPYLEESGKRKRIVTKTALLILVIFEILFMILLAGAGTKKYTVFNDIENPTDVYQELTVALSQGKTDLNGLISQKIENEEQGIEELQQLENPYEWSQRDGIDYKWDRAFYKGKYYCYFGIVPVLLFYLPFLLLTGKLLNTHLLALLLIMASAVAMVWLVYNIAKSRKYKVNVWLTLCAAAGFINCSMILSCVAPSNFYEVAKLSALVSSLIGINLFYNAFSNKKYIGLKLGLGAFFMALAVGCRPNFIFASFIAVPIVLNQFRKLSSSLIGERKNGKKNSLTIAASIFTKKNFLYMTYIAIPYIIVGVSLMYYNYIRFDSIFEFGAKYQLTVYDTSYYSLTDLGKLPVALYKGLFMMPEFSSEFPFINPVSDVSHYMGYFYRMAGMGVFAYPIMWLILLLPWYLKRGAKRTKDSWVVNTSLFVGLLSCFITTAMGGSSLGYSVDFAWMLYIPVIYIVFDLYEYAKKKKIEKYVFMILIALTAFTVIMNMLICFSAKGGNIANSCPELFYRLEKMIIFWR